MLFGIELTSKTSLRTCSRDKVNLSRQKMGHRLCGKRTKCLAIEFQKQPVTIEHEPVDHGIEVKLREYVAPQTVNLEIVKLMFLIALPQTHRSKDENYSPPPKSHLQRRSTINNGCPSSWKRKQTRKNWFTKSLKLFLTWYQSWACNISTKIRELGGLKFSKLQGRLREKPKLCRKSRSAR